MLADEAQALNPFWSLAILLGRPVVTWKLAASVDGRSAAADGTSRWITGVESRRDVHRLRAGCDAMLVGTGTALADDPHLTARNEADEPLPADRQPLRVVMGRRELAPTAHLRDAEARTLQLATHDPATALRALHERKIRHVWLEGGPTLAAAFVRAGLVDEVIAYVAPLLLGAGASALGDAGFGTLERRRCVCVSSTRRPSATTYGSRWSGRTEMFTGIVEELGEVVAIEPQTDAVRLTLHGPLVTADAIHGASIAVNGVCLTVVELTDEGSFTADVMQETLARSSLGALDVGSRVNLERPVTLADRLGGHLVQGHVDGTGVILDRTAADHWELVRVGLPADLARYVVGKGSITVDGVSLTVVEVGADWFTVSLIPTTLELTTLGHKQNGDLVNLEVDVIAKYVEKLLTPAEGDETYETRRVSRTERHPQRGVGEEWA